MVIQMIIRTYSELSRLKTFEERFEYLRLDRTVCKDTFGFDRYLNQIFYKTQEWKDTRRQIIIRDLGCDLGVDGYDIPKGFALIHHMNALTKEDIELRSQFLFDPEYLITTILSTHNAIHYGDLSLINRRVPIERSRNDTCPWRS